MDEDFTASGSDPLQAISTQYSSWRQFLKGHASDDWMNLATLLRDEFPMEVAWGKMRLFLDDHRVSLDQNDSVDFITVDASTRLVDDGDGGPSDRHTLC